MTALLLARLKAAGAPCSEPRTRAAALSYERSRSPEGGTRLRHPPWGSISRNHLPLFTSPLRPSFR